MTALAKALYAFWSQFDVPAYETDCVPDTAVLPYITYDVTRAGFNGQAILRAFNWHQRAENGNVQRHLMMDRISRAIPIGGVMLTLEDGGYVILSRNGVDFQMDWQDGNDPDVIGGRTSYILRNHTTT